MEPLNAIKTYWDHQKTNLPSNQHVISAQKTCLIDIPRLPPGSDRRPQVEAIQFVSNGLGHLEDQFQEQPFKKPNQCYLLNSAPFSV